MKTKLMQLTLTTVAILTLGVTNLTAGVLGKYNVKGKEDSYTFRGTLNLTTYTTCTVRLNYNDGDSVYAKGRFRTPLEETKKSQTVKCVLTAYGVKFPGKITVSGSGGEYELTFSYSGAGVSGQGSGSKKD